MKEENIPPQILQAIKVAESYAVTKFNEIIHEIRPYPITEYHLIMETLMQTFITEFIINVVMHNNFNANDENKMKEVLKTTLDTCTKAMERGVEAAKKFQEERKKAH